MLDEDTGLVALHIRSVINFEQTINMKAILKARACTIERRITVGNQIARVNLSSFMDKGGFTNFLNRVILDKYDELLIEIGIETDLTPEKPLKHFWNCQSTADLKIVSGHPDEKPVYVHKKFIMRAVPKIENFVIKLRQNEECLSHISETSEPSPLLATSAAFLGLHHHARTNGVRGSSDFKNTTENWDRPGQETAPGAAAQDDRSGDIKVNKPNANVQTLHGVHVNSKRCRDESEHIGVNCSSRENDDRAHVSKHIVEGVLSKPEPERIAQQIHSLENSRSNPISSSALIRSSTKPPQSGRNDHEIWLWLPSLPRNSCIDVMRWIYLKQLSPEFDLETFNPFMKLLAELGLWHHFQEHALRGKGYVFTEKNPLVLLRESGFQREYAHTYLREALFEAMRQRHLKYLIDNHQELQKYDQTGILSELFKSSALIQ
ncbi:hypothetical protein BGZ49_010424 [Haplosporangium sp. Z 27]|nr:hypothetical protein BGZ49_010424 [Haplosporangium sp. Z 27]